MPSAALENLAKINKLKAEAGPQPEFDGLLRSGQRRLAEYEGDTDIDVSLLEAVPRVTQEIAALVAKLGAVQ